MTLFGSLKNKKDISMPVSLNKVALAGSVRRAPRFQTTNSQKHVCNFVIAIPGPGKSVTFVDVTAWQNHADTAQTFIAGDEAIVTGRLISEIYEKGGRKIFKLSVVADSVDKVVQTSEAASEVRDE